jgi:hypothetical protein
MQVPTPNSPRRAKSLATEVRVFNPENLSLGVSKVKVKLFLCLTN